MKCNIRQTICSVSLITNLVAATVLTTGLIFSEFHLVAIGSYALSGALTNWLAVIMLFDKIPFLYGSGVIASRFSEFKEGIKCLIMEQFFTVTNIERFFQASMDSEIRQIDLTPVLKLVDYDQLFQSLLDAIAKSSLGSMLSFIGGREALAPLKEPFIEALQIKLSEMAKMPEITTALAQQHSFFHPEKVISKVDQIVDLRLQELTPQMVKLIIQNMIRKHLGWLVIWGGVFGGLIGLIVSLI